MYKHKLLTPDNSPYKSSVCIGFLVDCQGPHTQVTYGQINVYSLFSSRKLWTASPQTSTIAWKLASDEFAYKQETVKEEWKYTNEVRCAGEVWSSTLDLVSATRVPAVQTGQIYTNLTCAELLTTQWPGDSNAMKSEQFSTSEFDPLSLTCLPVPGLPVPGLPVPGTGMSMFVWNVCGCGCGCGCVIIFASS